MKLMPQSMWGRLSLLLISALLIAQLLSAVMHFRDRGELLLHAAGFNSSQRIAAMVHLLDALPPTQRQTVAQALDLPPLRLHLSAQPPPLPKSEPGSPRARLFHRLLHLELGENRELRIRVINTAAGERLTLLERFAEPMEQRLERSPAARMHARMMGLDIAPAPQTNFVAQVPLSEGQWVTFAYTLPQTLAAWPWDLLIALMVLSLVVIAVSFVAVRWLVKPLSLLSLAADALGRDIQHPPLAEEGPTEVRRASRAFNTMQARLRRFVEERTRILAAVSHDLKTPITRMRLRLESLPDDRLKAKFDDDLTDMQQMVQASLDFMRGMAIEEPSQPIDMCALLESLADDIADSGLSDQHAPLRVHGECLKPYSGKPMALKRCLSNLLENALRYGSSASIRIEDSPPCLTLYIEDDGPGVPEAELERVFEPFYRLEGSRNPETGGNGLGLSIARNIAQAHGGELSLRNRPQGGLAVCLSLPR